MATIKQAIARNTGGGSAASQYKKSAAVSARAFARAGTKGPLGSAARRKSLGGKGG